MERKHKRWNPGKGAYPGIGQISETPAPSRGDIWFADLGDHTGTSVQGGCRPVLVISNDTANIHAETVNVVPLTRHLKKPGLPCHMMLDSGDVVDSKQSLDDSMLLAEQITTILILYTIVYCVSVFFFSMAEENNCILMDSIKTAYSTAYSRMLLLAKSGKIGKIVSIDATATSLRDIELIEENKVGNTWNSINAWGPTVMLPVFQLLGTEYKETDVYPEL